MALFEFRFLNCKYLSFFGLVLISIFNYFDRLYSAHLTAEGVKRMFATLSKFTCGIFYFLSVAWEGKYKKIEENTKPLTFKQVIVLLLPGFLSALLYIVDYLVQLISMNLTISFTDNNLGTFVQLLTLFFVVHIGNSILFKKVTYIHHRVGIILIMIGTIVFHILKFFMFSPEGFDSYAKVSSNTFILLGSIALMSILQSGYVLAQSYLIHSCAYTPLFVIFITGVGFLIFYFPLTYILNGNDNRFFFLMDVDYPKMLFEYVIQCLYDYTHIKILKDLSTMHIVFNLSFIIILAYLPDPLKYLIFWFISAIFVIMGFLLYTQSIIVNACKLSYYIEENIRKRGEDEFIGELGETTFKKILTKQEDADNDDDNE